MGGSCVELATESKQPDAILISHSRPDHYGLLPFVKSQIPNILAFLQCFLRLSCKLSFVLQNNTTLL